MAPVHHIEKMGRSECGLFVLSCTVVVRLCYCLTTHFPKLFMHTSWRGVKEDDLRLKIVQAGEAVLRQTARALTREEITGDEIQRLIQDMKETMQDAPGVGLAAPQLLSILNYCKPQR